MWDWLKSIQDPALLISSVAMLAMVIRLMVNQNLRLVVGTALVLLFAIVGYLVLTGKVRWQYLVIFFMAVYPLFKATMILLDESKVVSNSLQEKQEAARQEKAVDAVSQMFEDMIKNPASVSKITKELGELVGKYGKEEQTKLKKSLFRE